MSLLRPRKGEKELQGQMDDDKAEGTAWAWLRRRGVPPTPAHGGTTEPRVQPWSRTGRGAGGALDLEDRFGGQPLIKTCCMKLKKNPSIPCLFNI